MSEYTKMDQELLQQYKINEEIFRQKIEDICRKYASVEDPGVDLCLETMTFNTRIGTVAAESDVAERMLNTLQHDLDRKFGETEKDLNDTEDELVMSQVEEEEEKEALEYNTTLEKSIESHPGSSFFEASEVSSDMLSLPEEQDPELERTFSSQSHGPSLQDLYPKMVSQIRGAYRRQQVSEVASTLRRKYRRQRWRTKHVGPGQSFMNSSVSGSRTCRAHGNLNNKTPPGVSKSSAGPRGYTRQARGTGDGQRSSSWKSVTSQAAEQEPVLVMNFCTPSPPSSGSSSPSAASPELNQTYVVEKSLLVPPHQQGRRQEAFHSTTGLLDDEDYVQAFSSPKRKNYEDSHSSPFKGSSVLSSPFRRHHNSAACMEFSPSRQQQEALSSPRPLPYTQRGLQQVHCSSPSRYEAPWTSPTRGNPRTHCPVRPQPQSPKARLWQLQEVVSSRRGLAETAHSSASPSDAVQRNPSCGVFMGSYSPSKQRFPSREAPQPSPPKTSPMKHSPIRSSRSSSAHRTSSLPPHPEIYTSPSHLHHHRDVKENIWSSPSRCKAPQMHRRSAYSLLGAEQGPARRLSSSIQQINQQFRQLYHQHICQRRSSASRHGPSGCLCEQRAECRSPSSRTSPAPTSTSTANSRLAALSLTPVRKSRFQLRHLDSLFRRLQRGRQTASPQARHQHHLEQQSLDSAEYSDDAGAAPSKMSEDGASPNLYRHSQANSSGQYPTGSLSSCSSRLDGLGLGPFHPRLSKRRCLSEPMESPSLKRFRECGQALSPLKPRGGPRRQHQQWGGDGDFDDDVVMTPAVNGLSEERRTRSRALLLQCPSPRFLRAASRLMKAGRSGSRSRSSLGAHPHASAWRSQQDRMAEADAEMAEDAWNESGMSPSVSRRRLLYGVPYC